MPQTFEITHAEKFPLELGRSPIKVQKSYGRTVVPILRATPDQSEVSQLKPLNGYKDLWRFRVSDEYRLVYRVNKKTKTVTLLMLDHRSKIYNRLGANADGTPGTRIILNAENLIERDISREEIGIARIESANYSENVDEPDPDKYLPVTLDTNLLTKWNISKGHHKKLLKVKTESELLCADIPDDIKNRVLDALWPPKIEEICQQPVRVNFDAEELVTAAAGERSLESFLLRLDGEQKAYANRFSSFRPSGPWLLKGGPGSGKSTVALYCIRSLLNTLSSELELEGKPVKILFTTFTNALINASEYLLKTLSIENGIHTIEVINVDKLALKHLGAPWKEKKVQHLPYFIKESLIECNEEDSSFPFGEADLAFLEDEIEWVLYGQGLDEVEEYFNADRSGRGRQLGQKQRRQIWTLHKKVKEKMHEKGSFTYTQRIREAQRSVKPIYDYVFIDEAQDLKPVAIRLCIGLCKNPKNVFLTADSNQSIYGSGMSWSRIASDLRFQGRARNLKKNYRTTKEIWDAVTLLAPDGEGVDRETLDVETVYAGPYPTFVKFSNSKTMVKRINDYLHEGLIGERVSPSSAAILCPSSREMDIVLQYLNPRYNGVKMRSRDVDLSHQGVKVMTMHAAKGLQFPIVIVVGVEKDVLPRPVLPGINLEDHNLQQKRLLFVACSRAMRRLLVCANRDRPSPFADNISDELWDIEDV